VPKGRGSPSLNAIKSLPAEYRLMQVLHTINLTTQQFLAVDAENSILRAQMNELTYRLESLNEMVNHMNALGGPAGLRPRGWAFWVMTWVTWEFSMGMMGILPTIWCV